MLSWLGPPGPGRLGGWVPQEVELVTCGQQRLSVHFREAPEPRLKAALLDAQFIYSANAPECLPRAWRGPTLVPRGLSGQ